MFNRFYANHFHFFVVSGSVMFCSARLYRAVWCCVVGALQTLENHYKIIIIKILACSLPQINYLWWKARKSEEQRESWWARDGDGDDDGAGERHANVCKQRKLPNGIFHMSDVCIKPSKQTRLGSVWVGTGLWALYSDHFVWKLSTHACQKLWPAKKKNAYQTEKSGLRKNGRNWFWKKMASSWAILPAIRFGSGNPLGRVRAGFESVSRGRVSSEWLSLWPMPQNPLPLHRNV